MSFIALDQIGFNPAHVDAGGRLRVSQLTTLFDGKTLNSDDTNKWVNVGTATMSFANNKATMSVTAGQFGVRQSPHYNPYFSGKSQMVELTFDNFHAEANVTKCAGYFSSNAVSPYASTYDGFWLESNANGVELVISRAGTEVDRVPWTDWEEYATIQSYDWQNFTVMELRFLWLGGTKIDVFMVFKGVLLKVHTYVYAGTAQDTMIRSPNQPVRFEIRSTTGSGTFRPICAQVSTEGSIAEQGSAIVLRNTTAIAANAVGTIYAIKGVKKQVANRDIHTDINDFGGAILTSGTTDAGRFLLLLNPTLSAALTYADNGRLQDGTAVAQTVSSTGEVIGAVEAVGAGVAAPFVDNYLRSLLMSITDTPYEVVLAYEPFTVNQTVFGHISMKVN